MTTAQAPARLRDATGADVAAVARLEQEVFGADAWSWEVVEAALAGGRRAAVVAEADGVEANGAVAGYAVAGVAGEVADLERIAVVARARRCGLATALLEAVAARALAAGATRLLLEVSEANTAARAFYTGGGAVELHRRRRYYRDGSDALVLEVRLGPTGEGTDG